MRHHNTSPRERYEYIDNLLAVAAPVSLLIQLSVWQTALIFGYGLLTWPLADGSFPDALREAGSSFFTLGIATTHTPAATLINFMAAVAGLVSVALLIGYLPTLYGAFNRRETLVTMLESRAGSPAWGPEILARQTLVGLLDALPALYASWELWAADVAETHSNYPILVRFRSPSAYRSWIVGLVAVMDSAALYAAFSPSRVPSEARLLLRQGFSTLRDVADTMRLSYERDPYPDDPVELTYEQFLHGVERLTAANFPMERTPQEAWAHFRGWRVNYESLAVHLADIVDAVPAPWTGTRTLFPQPIEPRRPRDRRPDDREGEGNTLFPSVQVSARTLGNDGLEPTGVQPSARE